MQRRQVVVGDDGVHAAVEEVVVVVVHFCPRKEHEGLVADGDGGRVAVGVDVQTAVGVGGLSAGHRGAGRGCGVGDDRHGDVTRAALEDDVTKLASAPSLAVKV